MWIERKQRTLPCEVALWALGLGLPLLAACQLTNADQVSRSPTVGHGSGGSSGHDLALRDEPTEGGLGEVAGPSAKADALEVAPPIDVVLDTQERDAPDKRDAPIERALADAPSPIDGLGWFVEAGSAGDTEKPCENDSFCERDKDTWTAPRAP